MQSIGRTLPAARFFSACTRRQMKLDRKENRTQKVSSVSGIFSSRVLFPSSVSFNTSPNPGDGVRVVLVAIMCLI